MHSIRMHTIPSLLYRRASLSWGLPETENPWTGTPLDREPPDRDPPGRNMVPEAEILRRNMGPGSQTGSDIIQRSKT